MRESGGQRSIRSQRPERFSSEVKGKERAELLRKTSEMAGMPGH